MKRYIFAIILALAAAIGLVPLTAQADWVCGTDR